MFFASCKISAAVAIFCGRSFDCGEVANSPLCDISYFQMVMLNPVHPPTDCTSLFTSHVKIHNISFLKTCCTASLFLISIVLTTPDSLLLPVLYTGNPNSAVGILLYFCFSTEGVPAFLGMGHTQVDAC